MIHHKYHLYNENEYVHELDVIATIIVMTIILIKRLAFGCMSLIKVQIIQVYENFEHIEQKYELNEHEQQDIHV